MKVWLLKMKLDGRTTVARQDSLLRYLRLDG
jgi:hypothetical protein